MSPRFLARRVAPRLRRTVLRCGWRRVVLVSFEFTSRSAVCRLTCYRCVRCVRCFAPMLGPPPSAPACRSAAGRAVTYQLPDTVPRVYICNVVFVQCRWPVDGRGRRAARRGGVFAPGPTDRPAAARTVGDAAVRVLADCFHVRRLSVAGEPLTRRWPPVPRRRPLPAAGPALCVCAGRRFIYFGRAQLPPIAESLVLLH